MPLTSDLPAATRPTVPDSVADRMAAARRVDDRRAAMRAEAEAREAEFTAADARGELWTAQAALYPGKAFVLIYRGHNEDMTALESQHGGCSAVFGPLRLTGQRDHVMLEAHKLFRVAEITIRVVA